MTDHIPPEDAQDLWQNQEPEEMTITLAEVRDKAKRLHRQALSTLILSAIGLLMLVIVPTVVTPNQPGLIPRVVWAIAMFLLFYPSYRAYKAGRIALADPGTTASVEFYRRELQRRANDPRTIIVILGVSVWSAMVVFESRFPLKRWIPFFVILAICGITQYFSRRYEMQQIKADLEQLNRLNARES
jgi:hypothetical protein